MRFVFSVLFIFLFFLSKAQFQLSENAKIAVATFGPYQGEVWSAFGHNGIRIIDPEHQIDWFYDYGLFDFNQENFFLNFAMGLLKYRIGVHKWSQVFAYQKKLNRYIKLQYLNLEQEEKQALFNYLQYNALPENAEYLYNYVYDNCATRIRDVVKKLYPDRIIFNLSYKEKGKTFRDLMDNYLTHQPWGDFGIDVGLGMQTDREVIAEEYMFLPEYIYKAFAKASISRDSIVVPLVVKTETVFMPKDQEYTNRLLTPFNTLVLLFFIVGLITHRNLKSGIRTKWVDTLLFSFIGFIGCWILFLWFGTEHLSKWNLNILWAIPFHLPLIFFVNKKKYKTFFRKYFKWSAYWYTLLLAIWVLLPQPLHYSLVPFVLTLVLRSFYLSYDLKK